MNVPENTAIYRKRIIFLSIIVIILFLGFLSVMVKMIIENGKCVDDPFRYAAVKLNQSGGNYDCVCNSLDPELLDFRFSAERGIEIINPNTKYFNLEDFDFSNI